MNCPSCGLLGCGGHLSDKAALARLLNHGAIRRDDGVRFWFGPNHPDSNLVNWWWTGRGDEWVPENPCTRDQIRRWWVDRHLFVHHTWEACLDPQGRP